MPAPTTLADPSSVVDPVGTLFSSSSVLGSSSSSSSSSISKQTANPSSDAPFVPTQTYLILATSTGSETDTATSTTSDPSAVTTIIQPSTASLPTDMPTIIVPANSPAQTAVAGADPTSTEGDQSLIDIVLNANTFPWQFVVSDTNATSQLFLTFPVMIANALNISSECGSRRR